ncbi:hypothetical protein J6O48_08780 [bacterium]|nr:hypothetical protein [bacterium]
MGEERKEYQVIGTVTIGTDEYRDLIEAVKDAQREKDEQSNKWYEQYRKATELEKENAELKERLNKYEMFIGQNEAMKDGFTLYCVKTTG